MKIDTVGIIGGGTMGSGIAIVTARTGVTTILIEKNQTLANAVLEDITQDMNVQIARWAMTESEKKFVLNNLQVGTDLELLKEADLVISAVPDDLDLKKQIFIKLNSICRPETIFTTNTSVLSVTELATVLDHPENMVGFLFSNPVLKTKLVEIVRGFKTSNKTYETGKAFIRSLGKKGIEVFESPGFVTTRLLVPFLNEAMYALLEGVASAEDIDMAIKLGYNMQMGPLELADRIGLDTLLNHMNHLFRESGDLRYRPCPLIKKLVRAQHLGEKTGEGFFVYNEDTGKRIPPSFSKP